jgi:hypothetical protein
MDMYSETSPGYVTGPTLVSKRSKVNALVAWDDVVTQGLVGSYGYVGLTEITAGKRMICCTPIVS